MGGFSADWLALREPADARARSGMLARAVVARFRHLSDVDIVDLAAGTGANMRYLAPFFSGERGSHWLLVDNDAALLTRAQPAHTRDRVDTRVLDLSAAFDTPAASPCAGRNLVTASALLDLVSGRWLDALARSCLNAGAAVLFALTYNGVVRCAPGEPEDDLVRELVNRHQRTDKGFGPALGPDAAQSAAVAFAALGYEVRSDRSDWDLAGGASELQRQLISGWADAAEELAPERAASLRGWKARRLAHVEAGRSRIVVGHEDMAGWLP